jgi:L-ascorbate metabolism protein UlaG (beta-lactamase superfamily)
MKIKVQLNVLPSVIAIAFCTIVLALSQSIRASSAASNHDSKMTQITWYGHSAVKVVTPRGKVFVIDPWLTNPLNPYAKGATTEEKAQSAIDAVGNVDYILLTHGHFDHVADATALAKKTHAKLIASFELGANMVKLMGFPADQAGMDTLGNAGGQITVADGEVKVNFVQAVHSSGLDTGRVADPIAYGGSPVGFVLQIKNGPTIYHSGDTAYYSDMEQIGKNFHPDVAFINIGGHFGMEPAQAAQASQAVKAKLVIPHHYKTFPILTQDPGPFFKLLDARGIAHLEMKPGQTIEFNGTTLVK